MRGSVIIFFATFFTLYALINLYIFMRGWQSLPSGSPVRPLYSALFILLALSFVGGRMLENLWMSTVSDTLIWIGSFWIAAMIYFFLALLVIDLLRLVHHVFHFFPASILRNATRTKTVTAIAVLGLVCPLLLAGYLNALSPRINRIELTIPKQVAGVSTLHIVAASDIHLGVIIGRKRFDQMVARINALNPDIILLPGDIVDENLAPVIKQNLGESLRNLKARFGVFAVTGNHEYIGGVEEATAYLSEHGVTVLRDQVVKVNDTLFLVGREDRSRTRFTGQKRKPLQDLLAQVDKTYPVLLMDHQPFQLEEGEENGVDLQLSGHTHHGQLWPVNFITKRVYEVSWGYKRRNGTHVYVSSGLGTWGPPVRLGNRPEIVSLTLRFSVP